MAKRGGYRPGAGGGSSGKVFPHDIVQDANSAKMQPLEYMLAVMNDRTADANRRDRMAIAAAPYVHGRVAENLLTKKKREAAAATVAGAGTPWGSDLEFENRINQ